MRFLFYSHDGLGLGHVRRHLAIASALLGLEKKSKILLATSVDEVSQLGLPSQVDTLKLPGLRKVANDHYISRRLGLQTREILRLRSALLKAAVKAFSPEVVLVDKHPFGAGGEFLAGLRAAREAGAATVLGLRDILDSPSAVRAEWFGKDDCVSISDLYHRVLVYGERSMFDPVAEYGFPPSLAKKTSFCGYVLNATGTRAEILPPGHRQENGGRQPIVLSTTGGGEDGMPLIREFLQAAKGMNWQAIAVTGPQVAEEERTALEKPDPAGNVSVRHFIPELPILFKGIDALVCMGGYNTLTEAAAHAVPTVCVPRTAPRTEQFIRAKLFEERGLLRILPRDRLDVRSLREEIAKALQTSRQELSQRARQCMHFDGARRAAEQLLDCAQQADKRKGRSLEPRPATAFSLRLAPHEA